MSSDSHGGTCPNCQREMRACTTTTPFKQVDGECHHCGFHFFTTCGYDTLEELNIGRENHNEMQDLEEDDEEFLAPLTELPKQTKF